MKLKTGLLLLAFSLVSASVSLADPLLTFYPTYLYADVPVGNDANPLSMVMAGPRLRPPELGQLEARLREIRLNDPVHINILI